MLIWIFQLQRNFQLILITHDEHFVALLARAQVVHNVYRVYKDVQGYSRLQPGDVNDLLSQD